MHFCIFVNIVSLIVPLQCFAIAGNTFTILTPDEGDAPQFKNVWLVPATSNHLQFEVMACQDAWVALTHKPGNFTYKTLMVLFGAYGNSKIAIEDGNVSVL